MTPVVAEFTGDGSARDLIVEARGDGRPGQSVAVILNGEELARVTLGNPRDASYARVPLPARKGRNTLELREVPPRTDLHRIAYQRIAIVPPRGGADGAGAPQGAGDSPR
jgi:hypothetical protein